MSSRKIWKVRTTFTLNKGGTDHSLFSQLPFLLSARHHSTLMDPSRRHRRQLSCYQPLSRRHRQLSQCRHRCQLSCCHCHQLSCHHRRQLSFLSAASQPIQICSVKLTAPTICQSWAKTTSRLTSTYRKWVVSISVY